MILVDANILIYAHNIASVQHAAARKWLDAALSQESPVCLAWDTIHAFLRITTTPALFDKTLPINDAVKIVGAWLQSPNLKVLVPGPRYWPILSDILRKTGVGGPRVTDAQLAALAIEHGATLCTADRDFRRFEGLRVENPLVGDPA